MFSNLVLCRVLDWENRAPSQLLLDQNVVLWVSETLCLVPWRSKQAQGSMLSLSVKKHWGDKRALILQVEDLCLLLLPFILYLLLIVTDHHSASLSSPAQAIRSLQMAPTFAWNSQQPDSSPWPHPLIPAR